MGLAAGDLSHWKINLRLNERRVRPAAAAVGVEDSDVTLRAAHSKGLFLHEPRARRGAELVRPRPPSARAGNSRHRERSAHRRRPSRRKQAARTVDLGGGGWRSRAYVGTNAGAPTESGRVCAAKISRKSASSGSGRRVVGVSENVRRFGQAPWIWRASSESFGGWRVRENGAFKEDAPLRPDYGTFSSAPKPPSPPATLPSAAR